MGVRLRPHVNGSSAVSGRRLFQSLAGLLIRNQGNLQIHGKVAVGNHPTHGKVDVGTLQTPGKADGGNLQTAGETMMMMVSMASIPQTAAFQRTGVLAKMGSQRWTARRFL